MPTQTSQKQKLFARAPRRFLLGALVVLLAFTVLTGVTTQKTAAATADTVNFQAKLMTSAGAIAADGNYNVEFNLYTAATGGTSLWHEDYLNSASTGVRVVNGYLTVNLGSVTAFPTTINWAQNLYVGMTVRGTGPSCSFGSCTPGDSEMTPRLKLTAVPYAFSAGNLSNISTGGFTSTLNFQGATVGNQVFNIPDIAKAGTDVVCLQSLANCTGTGGGIAGAGTQNYVSYFDTIGGNHIASLNTGNGRLYDDGSFLGLGTTTNSGLLSITGATSTQSSIFVQSAASATAPTAVIKQASSQTSDLLQFVDNAGNINGAFDSTGAKLSLGKVASGGTATQGKLVLGDGTTDNISLTFQTDALTGAAGNLTVKLPKPTSGTTAVVCYQGDSACGFAASAGAGVNTIGTLNAGTPNANGASITGTTLYLQSATPSNAGLVDTTTQTFAGDKTFNGNTTVAAGLNVTSGATVLTGSLATKAASDYTTTGAASDVNLGNASLVRLNGVSAQTLNSIAGGTDGRILTIVNAGTNPAVIKNNGAGAAGNKVITGTGSDLNLPSGASISLIYDAAAGVWRVNGSTATTGAAGVNTVGAVSTTSNVNGATITGTTLNLSVADGINAGLLSATTQTVGGAKTFTSVITGNAGLSVGGGALTLQGNAASSLTTTSGALTVDAATNLNLGTTTATGVTIGRTGITTTVQGNLSVTLAAATTANALVCQNTGGSLAACDASYLTPTAGNFIQNQNSSTQTGTFNINGTGTVSTLQISTTGSLDTSAAGAINIGGANATNINLNQNVTVAAGKSISFSNATGTTTVLSAKTTGDTNDRIQVQANGQINFGSGSATPDINLYRSGATALSTNASLALGGTIFLGSFLQSNTSGIFSNAASNGVSVLSALNSLGTTVATTIRGAASQTADLLQFQNSATTPTGGFNASGNLYYSNSGFTGTLQAATLSANQTYTLPNATGTLALTNDTTNFIRNQTGQQASSNFNISGTGIANILQAGTFDTTAAAALNIGSTNATSINLAQNTTIAAGKNITFAAGAGNFDQHNSTGTFQSGTGAVSLNGATSVTGSNTLIVGTGATTLGGSLATKKGTDYSTVGSSNNVNFGASSLVRLTGASAQTITGIAGGSDGYILTVVNAGTTSAVISNNSASSTATNRITTGTGADLTLPAGATTTLIYDSGASLWRVTGSAAVTGGATSGVTTVGAVSATATANGATITGNTLNLAVADASNAGLVSTSAQSFAGLKTFGGGITSASVNTTAGTNTTLGNSTGTFSLLSQGGLNVTTTGAITGVSTLTTSGIITVGALGAASNNTVVCYNSTNQLATCSGTFETTTGTDFIQNQNATTQPGTFKINGTGTAASLQIAATGSLDTSVAGAINIGLTSSGNGTSINLNQNTTIAGSKTLSVGGTSTFTGQITLNGGASVAAGQNITFAGATGNFDQSASSGTFATGSGNVNLNGNVTVASGANFVQNGAGIFTTGVGTVTLGGATFLGSTLNVADVTSLSGLTNSGVTIFSAKLIANRPAGGNIGTAALTVDVYTTFNINQTTTGQSLTLPTPTVTTAGHITYVSNVGTASFTLYGITAAPNTTESLVWNGSAWSVNGSGTTGNYIQNGTSQQASSNFNISGTGVANILQAGTFDTASAGVLGIGTTNATSINLGSTSSDFSVESNATANLFNGITSHTINLGTGATGANTNTVTIGSNNSNSYTVIQGGSSGGSIQLSAAAGGVISAVVNSGTVLSISGTTTTFGTNVALSAGKGITFAAGAGNFDQSASTGTFATGTGNVSLNGNTTIAGSKTFTTGTGTVALNGNTDIAATASLATKAGTSFTTAGTSTNAALNIASFYTMSTAGAAQVIQGITAGRDGQRLTLTNVNALAVTLANNNAGATGSKVITGTGGDVTLPTGASAELVYDATATVWRIVGATAATGGSGVNTIGTFSSTSIANGASISGNTLTLGVADATNVGLVSTTAQSIQGLKTFNSGITSSSINTTAGINTTLGNSTGTFQVVSSNFNLSTGGVVTLKGAQSADITTAAAATASAITIRPGDSNNASSSAALNLAGGSQNGSGNGGSVLINGGTGVGTGSGGGLVRIEGGIGDATNGAVQIGIGATSQVQIGTVANNGTTLAGNTVTISGGTGGNIIVSSNAASTDANTSLATRKGTDFATAGATTDATLGQGSLVRLTGASAQTLNSISGGFDGRILTIVNAGSTTATIKNNGTGTAGNKVITGTGSDLSLPAGSTITLIYDAGSGANVWRVTGSVAVTGGATSGVTTIGTFSSTSIANGASISGNTLTLGVADATNVGLVSTSAQSFAGLKTFGGGITATAINGTAGTNTTLGNTTGTFQLISQGGLNVSTTGALTGVASINSGAGNFQVDASGNVTAAGTINTDTLTGSALTFGNNAAASTIQSGTNQGLNILANGTGTLSLGNNGTANSIQIGNSTGAVIQSINLGTNATAGSTSNVTIGSTVAGTTVINGATAVRVSPLTTNGLVFAGGGNGTLSSGNLNLASGPVTGTLAVGNGGTGAATFTANGILFGNGTGAVGATAAGTAGQILLSNAGTPTFTTLGGDIASTSSTGSVTIATGAITSAKILDGTIVNADLSTGTFSNITGVGALTAGSITSTFGTISTTSAITTTVAVTAGSLQNTGNSFSVNSAGNITTVLSATTGATLVCQNASSVLSTCTNAYAQTNDTTNFIRNQTGVQASSNFNISGTGIANILQAGTFDTSAAAALNIGTTNATSINLGNTTTTTAISLQGATGAAINIGTATVDPIAIGKAASTTTIGGALTVTQALTGNAGAAISGGTIVLTGNANSSFTTTGGSLQLQGAGATSLTTTSGATSAAITIKTGDNSAGTAGTVTIDSGTSSVAAGAISIGQTNAQNINIGNSLATITLGGKVKIAANQDIIYSAGSGNFDQSTTTGQLKTGTGAVSLNGDTTIATGKNLLVNSGTTILGGSLATKKGIDFTTVGSSDSVNFGSTSLVRLTGASTQTIAGIAGGTDGYRLTIVNAASQAAVIKNSGSGAAPNNIVTGTGNDISLPAGASIELIYDGGSGGANVWRVTSGVAVTGGATSGVTTVGSLNGGTANATGATISGNTVFLQSASASFAGLVDTNAQTFAGAKTFAALITGQAGETISGGAISLNNSSNFSTSINGGSSTGAVTIGNGAAGAITLQSSAAINLTAGAASTISTGTNSLAITSSNFTFDATGNTSAGGTINATSYIKQNGQIVLNTLNGLYSTFIGSGAGNTTSNGAYNVAIGTNSLVSNSSGLGNVGSGINSLDVNSTGNYNTANGYAALFSSTTGSNNAGFGVNALYSNTTGSNNTGIGNTADVASGTLQNATAIGAFSKVGASDSLVLGCLTATTASCTTNTKVGVGTTTPNALFSVGTSSAFQVDINGNTSTTGTINTDTLTGSALTFGNNAAASTIQSGTNQGLSILANGTGTLSLGNNGTANSIQIGNTTGAVAQTINIGTNGTASSISNVNIGSTVAGTTVINGATAVRVSPLTTNGLVFAGGGNGTLSSGNLNLATGPVTGTLAVGNGGTGAATLTANGILYGNGAGAVQATGAGTAGQIVLSNAGTPTFTTLGGDIGSTTSTGVVTIATGAITSAKILDGTIANADLSTGTFGNITGVGALTAGSITSTFGTISTNSAISTTVALSGGSINGGLTSQFQVATTGAITNSSTYNSNTFTSNALTFGGAGASSINSSGSSTLTVDTGGAAALNLGNSNANAVSISKAGVTTTVNGGLTASQLLTANAGLTIATGSTFTNASSTLYTALALGNLDYSGSGNTGSIGANTATVDTHTSFTIAQTTAGQTFTIPSPSVATAGRIIYIANTGSQTFNIAGYAIGAGQGASYFWNGTAWVAATSNGGVNVIGTLNGGTPNATGASITGNSVYLQSATTSFAGLIDTTTQTFAGNKIFNGNLTTGAILQGASIQNAAASFAVNAAGNVTAALSATSGTTLVCQNASSVLSTCTNTYAQTNDSTNFIRNQTAQQAGNFNVAAASGVAGTLQGAGASDIFDLKNNGGALKVSFDASGNLATTANIAISGVGTFDQSASSGLFATGTGTVNLNGNTTVAGAKTLTVGTGLTSLGGGLAVTAGNNDLTNSLALKKGTDFTTNGTSNDVAFGNASLVRLNGTGTQTITGIAGGRDGYILTVVNAGSTTATLSNNNAGSVAANRIISGSGADIILPAGASINLVYDAGSTVWRATSSAAATGGAGVNAIGSLNGGTANANGAFISGTTVYLQSASASFAGLVDTTAQTFAGAKTFSSLITGQAGASITGGPITLTGNAASSLTTTAGDLNLQSAANLNIGTTSGTLFLGKAGSTATVNGALTVAQLLTGQSGATVSGAVISLNDNSNFNTTINTGTSTGSISIGNALAGAVSVTSGGTISLSTTSTAAITASNFNVSTGGVITLAGNQVNGDITTANAGTASNITLRPGNSTVNAGTAASLILRGGNQTSGTGTGGAVILDGGTGAIPSTVSIGTTNAGTINVGGRSGSTLNLNSFNINTANNSNVYINPTGGNGALSQTYYSNNGSGIAVAAANTDVSGGIVNGISISPLGFNASGSNTVNALLFGSTSTSGGANTFNGLNFGTGYTNLLTSANASLTGTGVLNLGAGSSAGSISINNNAATSTISATSSANPTGSNALIYAANTNATPTGNLLNLLSGSTPTSKFSVDASGNVIALGKLKYADSGAAASALVCKDGSGYLSACTTGYATGSGAAFVQGGNDFGANAVLGTNGAGQTLSFETAGTSRVTLDATGSNFTFLQAANINTQGAAALSIDTGGAAALGLGTGNANAVNISKAGVTTNVNGALTAVQLLTGQLGATVSGGAVSLNDNTNFNTTINSGTSTGTVTIGSTTNSGSFTLESGTAQTNLFNAATAHTIKFATGAAAQIVTIGSTNTSSSLALQAGTNGVNITTGAGGAASSGSFNVTTGTSTTTPGGITLETGTSTVAGLIAIGTVGTAHTINVGTGTTNNAITVGNAGNTTSTLTLQAGTNAAAAVNIQTGVGGSTAGGINIGNTTGTGPYTQAITIGTNTTASTITNITIGSTVAGTISLQSAVTAKAGLAVTNGGSLATQKAAADYTLTGAQTDANLGTASLVRLNGASSQTLNSIAGGVDGRILTIVNAAATAATIKNNGAGTAGNLVITGTGSDLNLPTGASISLIYDAGTNVWRVNGSVAVTGGATAGVTTVGSLNGGTANATGATISGNIVYLQSASGSFAGLIDTAAQSFAGLKTFTNGITAAAINGTAGINTVLGNATGSFQLASTGGLNVSTAGDLTGVNSINSGAGNFQVTSAGAVTAAGLVTANAGLSVSGGTISQSYTGTGSAHSIVTTGNPASSTNALLVLNNNSATPTGNLIDLQNKGVNQFTIDVAGNVVGLGSLTTGTTGQFAVNGATGNVTATGTYNTNTFTGSALSFGNTSAATISLNQAAASTAGGTVTVQGGQGGAGASATNGGDVIVQGGGIGASSTGVQGLVRLSTSVFSAAGNQSFAANGAVTQASVDGNSTIEISSTVAGPITVTIPAPTQKVSGRLLYITISGANQIAITPTGGTSFTMNPATGATLVWNTTINAGAGGWVNAGADGGSNSYVQNQSAANQAASFRISGTGQINNNSITTGSLLSITQSTSAFTGTGILLNVANGSGTSTGKLIDLQNNSVSKFTVDASGNVVALGGITAGTTGQFTVNGTNGNLATTGQSTLGGATNQTQVIIKANSGQSSANPLLMLQNSSGVELARVTGDSSRNFFAGYQTGAGAGASSSENTAVGYLSQNTLGNGTGNTSIGAYSLLLNYSAANTALGYATLSANTIGYNNTATGYGGLGNNTTGFYNTSNGESSLTTNTVGNNNSGFGYHSDVGANNLQNATAIGTNSYVTASNSLVLGCVNGTNGCTSTTKIGIGNTAPAALFSIGTGSAFQVDQSGNTQTTGTLKTGSAQQFSVDASGNVVATSLASAAGLGLNITANGNSTWQAATGNLNVQATTGNLNLVAGSAAKIQASAGTVVQATTDNALAFTTTNSVGANILSVDTTNTNNGTNVAINGGAESGTTGWSAVGAATVSQDTTVFASGAASIKAVVSGANQGSKNAVGSAVSSTGVYTASFALKSSVAAPALSVYFFNGATNQTCNPGSYDSANVTTKFVKYTCVFTAGATSASAYFAITTTSGTPTLNIDNLSIVSQTTAAASGGDIRIGGATGQGLTLLTLDSSAGVPFAGSNPSLAGSLYFDTTSGKIQCYDGTVWGACGAAPNTNVTLTPEFTGAVLNGTGIGTLTSDFCANSAALTVGTLCGTNDARNFYKWTSPQSTGQPYSIYVTYKLPSTFKSFVGGSTTLTGRSDNLANASVSYQVFKSTGSGITSCGAATTVTTTVNTWQPVAPTTDITGCGFAGGNNVIFQINVSANTNASAYVENLNFNYTNQ